MGDCFGIRIKCFSADAETKCWQFQNVSAFSHFLRRKIDSGERVKSGESAFPKKSPTQQQLWSIQASCQCSIALLATPCPLCMTSNVARSLMLETPSHSQSTNSMQATVLGSRHHPDRHPLLVSQCSLINAINQKSSAQGVKNRAPAQHMGFVLILSVSQNALNLLQHLQADPWMEEGEEASADVSAPRKQGSRDVRFLLHRALIRAKMSMSEGRGAIDGEADVETEGVKILKNSSAVTLPQHKHWAIYLDIYCGTFLRCKLECCTFCSWNKWQRSSEKASPGNTPWHFS